MRRWMAGAALGALLATGLTGCSDDADRAVDDAADRASELTGQAADELEGQLDDAELPKVDWSQYGDRLRILALLRVELAEVNIRADVIGVDAQDLLKIADRFFRLVLCFRRETEQIRRLRR